MTVMCASAPRTRTPSRRYRPLYPRLLDARVSPFVFEHANRERSEIELRSQSPTDKEVDVGVIDVKAFRVETPEKVVGQVRLALEHIPAGRLRLVPDGGLWETRGRVGVAPLRSMVETARVVRRELGLA
jgi:5-methyltetrahydropteroyltriglutamate--homocysteine methyltransferase